MHVWISCARNYISIKVPAYSHTEPRLSIMSTNELYEDGKIETLADMHIKYLFARARSFLCLFTGSFFSLEKLFPHRVN